jgi:thiamine pyrophosphate-dependent acetolactate synthase large subunit-like protein
LKCGRDFLAGKLSLVVHEQLSQFWRRLVPTALQPIPGARDLRASLQTNIPETASVNATEDLAGPAPRLDDRLAPARPPAPDPKPIEKACALIAKARHPVIVAGGGIVDHGRALTSLAEKIGAPVIPTIAAKGTIPEIGVRPRNPDFIKMAEAFGCHTARPRGLEEFKASLTFAFLADGPTLIEIREDADFLGG